MHDSQSTGITFGIGIAIERFATSIFDPDSESDRDPDKIDSFKQTSGIRVHSEKVACVSDQGRRQIGSAGVTALRRGIQSVENADMERKMPSLGGYG